MRRQSITIRCDGDGCKNIADVEDLNAMAVGWYRVFKATEDGKLGREGWDLCSLRCVGRWSKGRAAAIGEAPPASNGGSKQGQSNKRVVCPACGHSAAVQGFHQHWKAHHADLGEYVAGQGVVLNEEGERAGRRWDSELQLHSGKVATDYHPSLTDE